MKDFHKLMVWQKSHELTLRVYEATKQFPKEELYGLNSQIRRASSSIPANIAEGCGRKSEAELGRFLYIAMGSASELEYFILLAKELKILDDKIYIALNKNVVEIKKMLFSLIKKLKADG